MWSLSWGQTAWGNARQKRSMRQASQRLEEGTERPASKRSTEREVARDVRAGQRPSEHVMSFRAGAAK